MLTFYISLKPIKSSYKYLECTDMKNRVLSCNVPITGSFPITCMKANICTKNKYFKVNP